MLVSCMSLFTKHNYRAKKLNNLTLKCSTQREQGLLSISLMTFIDRTTSLGATSKRVERTEKFTCEKIPKLTR
jgi:hypothetical protein